MRKPRLLARISRRAHRKLQERSAILYGRAIDRWLGLR